MTVGRVVNKLSVADKHSRVGNVDSVAPEEEEISSAQFPSVNRYHASPRGLQVGVARHGDPAAAHQHLRESRAVVAEARAPAPQVGQPKEAATQRDGFFNAQFAWRQINVSCLNPSCALVGQANLKPISVVALSLRDDFEPRLNGNGQQRPMQRDISFTVEVCRGTANLSDPAGSCIAGLAGLQSSYVLQRYPSAILIGGSHLFPYRLFFPH